jgi:predicted membrane-bound spermidine synthase
MAQNDDVKVLKFALMIAAIVSLVYGLCIGTLMVYSKPEKQNIFVTSIALAHLLSGLGLLYSWIMQEYSGATWFIAIPTCLLLVLSALLFWGRGKAKGIL